MDELAAIAARVRAREAGEAVGPWTLELYPTLRCNLDCAFCDTTDRHRPAVAELSPARLVAILEEAAAMGARRVFVLGGGEPLLSAATPLLVRRAKELGLLGFLTTNGTRLDAATRTLLVEVGWDDVHVSLDGASPATHDALRGKPGAFARTVRNVCALRKLRGDRPLPRLAVHTVLTNRNAGELVALVRLAAALGCERFELDALVAYRPEQRALALSPAQRAAIPDLAREALAEADRLGLSSTLANFLAGAPDRGTRLPAAGTGEGLVAAPCLKAWHHLVVQADGRTSPCCVLAGEGESVADTALAALWPTSPYLEQVRAGMRAGRPTGRCAECSENILAHERAIRSRL
jgi:MoaA/NifB/PqqE/SkfB family radical SAM enzyme